MTRDGYSDSSALEITGDTMPYRISKHGNYDVYTLNNEEKAIIKFSKFYSKSKSYWYGITPKQMMSFKSEAIDYYYFITGYIGVVKVPTDFLQQYLVKCNVSVDKNHPENIRHYHVMIQYIDDKVCFYKGPDITGYFYCDDDSDKTLEKDIRQKPRSEILDIARQYVDPLEGTSSGVVKRRARRESRAQKYRIACIEDFTCQVCGYREHYKNEAGQDKYIYEVDHIKDKALGFGETIDNLWVLCPICHARKTRGIITVDTEKKKVYKRGKEITIMDHHLFC